MTAIFFSLIYLLCQSFLCCIICLFLLCFFPEKWPFSLVPLGPLRAAVELTLPTKPAGRCPSSQCRAPQSPSNSEAPTWCCCVHMHVLTRAVSQCFPHRWLWWTALVANCSLAGHSTATPAHSVVQSSMVRGPYSLPHPFCSKDAMGGHVTGYVQSRETSSIDHPLFTKHVLSLQLSSQAGFDLGKALLGIPKHLVFHNLGVFSWRISSVTIPATEADQHLFTRILLFACLEGGCDLYLFQKSLCWEVHEVSHVTMKSYLTSFSSVCPNTRSCHLP